MRCSKCWFSFLFQRLLIQFENLCLQFRLSFFKFLQYRSHQQSLGRKNMSATIEARFHPKYTDPNPLFLEVFSLDERRTAIADSDDYFLVTDTIFICVT